MPYQPKFLVFGYLDPYVYRSLIRFVSLFYRRYTGTTVSGPKNLAG